MSQKSANSGGKQDTRFKPGQSGNPGGKPRGTRHKTTVAAEALLDGEAERLTRKAVEVAMTGDVTALRLCLERIVPPRRDRPVLFNLPPLTTAAVAAGDLTPTEAGDLSALVERFVKVLEAADFEQRLAALEAANGGKK